MSEWIEMTLGEIGYFKSSGVDKVIKPDEKIVRLVNYMDVYGSVKIDNSFSLSETSATQHESDSFDLKKGDVLFTPTSETPDDIGHSAVVIEDLENAVYSYHLTRFREFAEKYLDDEFKAFLFNQYYVLHQFEKKAAGTTRFTLTRGSFESTIVRFPKDKKIQNTIAKVLSTADAVIEKTQAAIAKYKVIKQGMLQDLFPRGIDISTNKLRPRFEEAPHLYKESKIGMIPREWDEKKLGEICSMKSGEGITSPNIFEMGDFPVYGGNGLRGFTSIFTHDGEFTLIGRQGALCGNITRVRGKFYASEHAVVVTPENNIELDWLSQKLFLMNLNQYSEATAQPGLSVFKILPLLVSMPPFEEQKTIAERLTAIDNKLQTEQTYLQKMQSLKKGLMEELLSGKRKVKSSLKVNS